MRPGSCVLHACQSFFTHQSSLFNVITPEVFWKASASVVLMSIPFLTALERLKEIGHWHPLPCMLWVSCAWTSIQLCPFLCLFLYRPVCSSRCGWTSLNFPVLLWGPAAPQVMAVCALHTNKPVSLKDTVYSSTQRPATVRIQRRFYQCNANREKEHGIVP